MDQIKIKSILLSICSFAVASGAVSKPGGDTAGQDALHSAGVE